MLGTNLPNADSASTVLRQQLLDIVNSLDTLCLTELTDNHPCLDMQTGDSSLSEELAHQNDNLTAEEKAATLIQANYRGYVSRKTATFTNSLHNCLNEEKMRIETSLVGPTDTTNFLESVSSTLMTSDDDNSTCANKYRHYEAQARVIQRVWRHYRRRQELTADRQEKMSIMDAEGARSDDEESLTSLSSPVNEYPSDVSFRDEEPGIVPSPRKDEDSVSIVSDISEIAEPLREHFVANVKIINKEDLEAGNTMYEETDPLVQREPDESDMDYEKRVKKINYLSLAQEFAELKKFNKSALPLNLHSYPPTDDTSADTTPSEDECQTPLIEEKASDGAFEYHSRREGLYKGVRTSESMPSLSLANKMNWSLFSRQIEMAEEAKKSRRNDREEIRRKLAMGSDEDYYGGERAFKKPSLQTRLQGGMNLQLCFMNEAPSDSENNEVETSDLSPSLSRIQQYSELVPPMQFCFINDIPSDDDDDDDGADHVKPEYLVNYKTSEHSNGNFSNGANYGNASSSQSEASTQSRDCDRDWTRRNDDRESTPVASSSGICECGRSLDDVEEDEINLAPRHRDIMKYFEPPKQLQPPLRKSNCRHGPRPVSEADIDLYQLKKLHLEGEDFFSKQARLQAEARMALAQVRPMAHMQLEIERQNRKKSPIAEIVGVPGLAGRRARKTPKQVLMFGMNMGQLQTMVNDLHSQIEALNEELVTLLVERDDLHMEQDSMLVDIEDLTRRAQEWAGKVNQEPKPIRPTKSVSQPISMGRKLLTSVRKK